MNIQSLSVCVPTVKCTNNCKFCCSAGHNDIQYKNNNMPDEFFKRLQFARDNGCNVAILTGECEPLQQYYWLNNFFAIQNKKLASPFKWIELQTSGVNFNREQSLMLGVTTVSLSLTDPFVDEFNFNTQATPKEHRFDVEDFCQKIIKDFNLRISLNMTDLMKGVSTQEIIERCVELGAYALTFRELYEGPGHTGEWVKEHKISVREHFNYIKKNGKPLEELPNGTTKYSIGGLSVVVDNDCMSQEANSTVRYLILRPDGKLYTKWNDKASLLF